MRGVYPQNLFNSDFYSKRQSVVIDLKGFTKTCANYIHEDIYGLEKISNLINELFNPVINEVYKLNGEVLSFSGDAMLITIKKDYINELKTNTDSIIRKYNQRKKGSIGIHFDILHNTYYPYTIKTQPYFFYYPLKSNPQRVNIEVPNKIKDIHGSMFKGELRIVPVSFIHIKENIDPQKMISFVNKLSKHTEKHGIYINKIEFLDKGWIILLSSGLPFYINDATLHLYEFLQTAHKIAQKENIPLSASITVQKEYCGIIGNEKRWEYTFIGHGVNMAARMAVKEKDGIICDENFSKINKDIFAFNKYSRNYKGIGKADVFSVKSRKKQTKKSIFIGREKETETAISLLSKPFYFIFIYGPSGIGKTYLVRHILNELNIKTITIRGDSNSSSPLSLFANSPFENDALSRKGIQRYFNNIKDKTIIFIDDLQFADTQSLDIIRWMLSVNNPNLNFIATAFTNKIIKEITPPISNYSIVEIPLHPFKEKEIKEILEKRLKNNVSNSIIKKIIKISKGNPLFVQYIIDSIKEDINEIPYNIEEIIFSKIEKLPQGGSRFINDASIYGDIFNKIIIGNIENIKIKQLNNIENKGYEEGLIEKERMKNYLRFQNNIIRETVFSSILKKEIDYIRNKIGEELLKEKGINTKTCDLFYLTNNIKFLDIAYKIINKYIKNENYHSARNYLIRAMEFIKRNKIYDKALPFIEQTTEIPSIYLNNRIAESLKSTILKIKNFQGKERLLINTAEIILSVQFEYDKVAPLVEQYKNIKGEDVYYTWKKLFLSKYSLPDSEKIINTFNRILTEITNKTEKIDFLLDYVSIMFFRFGIMKNVNKGLKILKTLENEMNKKQKEAYYKLLSSIFLHYDKIEDSLKYIEKSYDKNKRYNQLINSNDFAIIYFHLGVKNNDKKMIEKSMRYAKKAYKFVKDESIYSIMPLITTNLGTSCITYSKIKDGINFYYEGLRYGEYIKHPVEVPFTKSRIALFSYGFGSRELSYRIGKDIEKSVPKITDLLPMSYTLLYLKINEKNYFKEGLKIAKELANDQMPKCLWEISRLFLDSIILYDRKDLIDFLYKNLHEWHKKYKTRYFAEMINEINILILKYLKNKNKRTKEKLLQYAQKLENIGLGDKTLAMIYYIIDEEEYLKKAYKHSKKAYIHPLSIKILQKLQHQSLYYKHRLKEEENKLKEIEKIKTIKQLVDFINGKD